MTLHDAIDDVQRVGSIRAENGKLKLRFPDTERFRLNRLSTRCAGIVMPLYWPSL